MAVALLFLLFNVWDLTLYPLVADDEVLLNEPARVLALHGTLESPLLSPDHVPRHVLVQPPVQTLAVGTIYLAAGFGIWQTRLASLLWGAVAVGIVTFVASRIGVSSLAGVFAAMLLALNPSFALSVRMGRMDALCLAFAVSAFAVLTRRSGHDASAFAAFGAGVLTALACLTHFVAFGFLAGMLLVLVLGPAPRWRRCFAFIAGGATIAALWGLFFVWQGWDYVATLAQSWEHAVGRRHDRREAAARGLAMGGRCQELRRSRRLLHRGPGVRIQDRDSAGACEPRRGDRCRHDAGVQYPGDVQGVGLLLSVSGRLLTLLAATYLADRMHVPPPHRTVAMALLVGAVVSSLPMLVVPRAAAVFVQREARSYAAIETGLRN